MKKIPLSIGAAHTWKTVSVVGNDVWVIGDGNRSDVVIRAVGLEASGKDEGAKTK